MMAKRLMLKNLNYEPEFMDPSWLFMHISAYEPSPQLIEQMKRDLEQYVKVSKSLETPLAIIYSLDGEKELIIQNGRIRLVLPLRAYELVE